MKGNTHGVTAAASSMSISGYTYGGIGFGSTPSYTGIENNLGPLIKNKEIFEKAQQREKTVDWYSKLQDSKEAFLAVGNPRLSIIGGEFGDPTGVFDQMISAKKEAKELTSKKP